MFCNSNGNKTVFLVLLKYREIMTVKTVKLNKNFFKARKVSWHELYFIMSAEKYSLAKKLNCIEQSRFYIFSPSLEFRNV